MEETIEIKASFESWKMTIILPNALPSFSISEFRRLLKYIEKDFEMRDVLLEQLESFLSERLNRIPGEMKDAANCFSHYDQKVKDTERQLKEIRESIKNKRTSIFMPLSKDQIKELKAKRNDLKTDLSYCREDRKDALSRFKELERCKKKFEKEMEVLKEWKQ